MTVDRNQTLHLAAAALALLSVAYYALYINAGFNYSDDGNYAQTAYELFLGRPPLDLDLSYGLMWYQAGAALFHLFGVDFLLVRLLFFGTITLTTLLVFYSLARATGSILAAGLLAAVIALVPAFPATAFYGLCVALNAAAQLRLARRKDATAMDGALAGAALAASFQIRPDFGFIFAGSLAVTVLLLFWPRRQSYAPRIAAGIVGGFAVVALPAAALAFAGGYGSILTRQYLDYPKLLVGLLLNGLTAGPTLGLLARPGLAAPGLAALVYLPLAIFAAAGAYFLLTIKDTFKRDVGAAAQMVIALAAGVAAFPHYFLYRPDISHIANFMPGFVLMAGVFLGRLKENGIVVLRPLAFAGAGLTGLYFVLYLAIGLPSPATGSIGMSTGRTEPFTAANGVNVKVAPGELAQLTFLRDTVLANSRPGDAIVCVPYCPGVAFMTGRRMLLHNFYVDDTFPQLRPRWLATAIAETRAARPPVVIVQDWAINGTEQSRFANWAATYIDAVKEQARDILTGPATTIYLINPTTETPPS
ncbi:MAG: hypothetical protein K1X51_05605 [Rhodospirillaceae bacterium]|nr:hypothetical protein [Rhodospirillaceae bacterium]